MIHVTGIRLSKSKTWATLSARVRCAGSVLDGRELWFRYPPRYYDFLSTSADPWIPALVTVAMRLHQPLHVEAPASPRLLEGAQTFMDIMRQWRPDCERVPLETEGVLETVPQQDLVGAFFTAGVDAFYTLLKNHRTCQGPDRISRVLFIHGFDVPLSNLPLYGLCREHIVQAARALGTIPILCATNIKEETYHRGLDVWDMCHGQMLLAVALAAESLWRRFLIPATAVYTNLAPWGSHPLTDPLWSTESMTVVHDGAEATRIEKVMTEIAPSEVALEHLRVCWQNRGGRYNCGECEKCLRTMVTLQVAGVLDQCRAFDRPLRHRDVAHLIFVSPEVRLHMLHNYEVGMARHADPSLLRAMRRCVYPSLSWRCWRGLCRGGKVLVRELDRLLLGGRIREQYRRWRSMAGPNPGVLRLPAKAQEQCDPHPDLTAGSVPVSCGARPARPRSLA
jgi:hypothetical protein